MNPRVLELLKNPKNIQSEDLGLLKDEIHTFPYVQNIRALHLFGVHLYDKENYQKELSTTAAYTTDKKLLYQLINGKIRKETKPELTEEKQSSKSVEKAVKYSYKEKVFPIKREEPSEKIKTQYEEAAHMIPPVQDIKHIYINGERNRILFEGEENFLDEANSETIDLESTLESGVLVTQKAEPAKELDKEVADETEAVENEQEENSEADVAFTPELIIEEDKTETTTETAEEEDNLSFHEIEAFVPDEEIAEEKEQENVVEESVTEEKDEESVTVNSIEDTIHEEVAEPEAEISFHGMDEFLPEVKIQGSNNDEAVVAEISKPNVNKHEEEMRRLIEEVEKKMKEAQAAPKTETDEPETTDHEISFAETQSFHFWSTEKEEPKAEAPAAEPEQPEPVAKQPEAETEQTEQNEEPAEVQGKEEKEVEVEKVSGWKPMSLESNLPDSVISKEKEVPVAKTEVSKQDEISPVEEKKEEIVAEVKEEPQEAVETVSEDHAPEESETPEPTEEKPEEPKSTEEAPVMNVSFFGSDISSLSVEKEENADIENEPALEVKAEKTPADSNVPGFINTWQSWLKIERPAEEPVEKDKTEVQEKVIEAFIENNPRISQLKEESTYVVKEKNDDISHLMTETLANLYFEQKLYTKAIKAFEILINKNPEKKEYFQSKIQEIKDFRSKG
ncbi:prolipoprotein diacylglyceryl transferase [Chryseobacterium phocaeense]|uniref:hypothetical protein n=1 Tax=Chryseobacterium phocaeense TaxID=1816690 RepID=UPI0009BBF714|nr:hypothetical protein [Chryseobacterium phocaeense]